MPSTEGDPWCAPPVGPYRNSEDLRILTHGFNDVTDAATVRGMVHKDGSADVEVEFRISGQRVLVNVPGRPPISVGIPGDAPYNRILLHFAARKSAGSRRKLSDNKRVPGPSVRVAELERELVEVRRERDELKRDLFVAQAMDMRATCEQWEGAARSARKRVEEAERKIDMLAEALEHYAIPEGDDGSIRHADGAIARKALASLEER